MSSGSTDFTTRLDKLGGYKSLVKEPLARNMWNFMKDFKVLPTEQRFQDMSDEFLEFIFLSYEQDAKDERRRRGLESGDSIYEDDDDEIFDRDRAMTDDEWMEYQEEFDQEDIKRQMAEMTDPEEQEHLADKYKETRDRANSDDEAMSAYDKELLDWQNERAQNAQKMAQEVAQLQAQGKNPNYEELYKKYNMTSQPGETNRQPIPEEKGESEEDDFSGI